MSREVGFRVRCIVKEEFRKDFTSIVLDGNWSMSENYVLCEIGEYNGTLRTVFPLWGNSKLYKWDVNTGEWDFEFNINVHSWRDETGYFFYLSPILLENILKFEYVDYETDSEPEWIDETDYIKLEIQEHLENFLEFDNMWENPLNELLVKTITIEDIRRLYGTKARDISGTEMLVADYIYKSLKEKLEIYNIIKEVIRQERINREIGFMKDDGVISEVIKSNDMDVIIGKLSEELYQECIQHSEKLSLEVWLPYKELCEERIADMVWGYTSRKDN